MDLEQGRRAERSEIVRQVRFFVTVLCLIAPAAAALVYVAYFVPANDLVPHPIDADDQVELYRRQALTDRLLFFTALLSLVTAGAALLPHKWVPGYSVKLLALLTALFVALVSALSIWS